MGTILGVPIIRTIVFGGLYWGPPIRETTMCVPRQRRNTNARSAPTLNLYHAGIVTILMAV